MSLLAFFQLLADSPWSIGLHESQYAYPIVESIHVLAAATVFGTILIVDLRLLGFPNTRRSFTRVSDEMLRLTWIAFAAAVITGASPIAACFVAMLSSKCCRTRWSIVSSCVVRCTLP